MVRQISIPKTPKSAYNPTRKPSDLIKSHIAQLEAVTAAQRTAIAPRPKKPRTESQASAYIAELTARLNPPVAAAPTADTLGAVAPANVSAPPVSPASAPAAAPRRRRRAAAKKPRSRAKATRAGAQSRTGRRRKGSAKK